MVPEEVQRAVLKEYLRKCSELHNIAFFQWRLKYPNEVRHDPIEIEKIISTRIRLLPNNCAPLLPPSMPAHFFQKYSMYLHDKNLSSFNIVSLDQIGMPDPFKKEWIEAQFPLDGYSEDRYVEGESPSVVYIPSKQIMIKLMRACIGVK